MRSVSGGGSCEDDYADINMETHLRSASSKFVVGTTLNELVLMMLRGRYQ